ncbi:MAG TPA: hypothetical protein VLV86_06400 [Vicinamibacterales bacterium]|nr:hypothetical protein [Vicinamibacterales bacterium]
MSDADRGEVFAQWQREHAAALAALQEAQRDYHRTVAATAFQGPSEEPSAEEMRRASLEALDAARVKLDEIRSRRPQTEAS